MLYLEVETRAGTQRIPLVGTRMSIGRLSDNDIVISDSQISRQHAELRFVDGEWWIADLKSTNGIHLADRRVPVHRLRAGDALVLAPDVHLVVRDDAHADPRARTSAQGTLRQHSQRMPPAPQPGQPPQQQELAPLVPQASPPTVRAHGSNGTSGWSDVYAPASPTDIAPPAPPSFAASSASRSAPSEASPSAASPPEASVPPPASFARSQPTRDERAGSEERWSGSSPHTQHVAGRSTGGPAPSGPFSVGGETDDPFRRSLSDAAVRPNLIPAQSLLHVCQTCGQLTAPDAIYCQSCHHSIAYACAHCGLSLLPIQDRCPRCQAPNPASVRRAHRIPS